MKNKHLRWLALGAAVAILSLSAQAQQVAGQIKAVRVVGEVTVTHGSSGASERVNNNQAILQSDIITTAKDASIILVFSNGSTINLGQDSRLAIDEFLQDPFSQQINLGDLTEEPGASSTRLTLTYGELVGNVKKLKSASTYRVQTPVGAAGIRGTTFRIVFRLTGDGRAFFTISTADGTVIYEGITGTEIPVPVDQEVVVTVEIDDAGNIVGTPEVQTQNLSADAKAAIQSAAADAAKAAADVIIQPPEPPRDESPPPEEQPPPKEQSPAPPQEQSLPKTTPGDGLTG